MGEGAGVGESCQEGWAGVRLCNLAAQSTLTAEGSVQAGSGEGTNGAGDGTMELYKTQISVVEQAIETAALMLGTDKSRGYCLEMICADFLAGANLDNEDPTAPAIHVTVLQIPAWRTTAGLSARSDQEGFVNRIPPKQPRQRLDPELYERLRQQVLCRDGWRCQRCGTRANLEVHHQEFRSRSGDDSEGNLITLCAGCHATYHG